jgi:hypothetical protein
VLICFSQTLYSSLSLYGFKLEQVERDEGLNWRLTSLGGTGLLHIRCIPAFTDLQKISGFWQNINSGSFFVHRWCSFSRRFDKRANEAARESTSDIGVEGVIFQIENSRRLTCSKEFRLEKRFGSLVPFEPS